MAWVNIPDTATDPDAPLTSSLAKAWTGNPIAIANGEAGAPRIMPQAQDVLIARFESWDGGIVTVSGLPPIYLSFVVGVRGRVTAGEGAFTLEMRASADGGSSYSPWIEVGVAYTNRPTGGGDESHGLEGTSPGLKTGLRDSFLGMARSSNPPRRPQLIPAQFLPSNTIQLRMTVSGNVQDVKTGQLYVLGSHLDWG